jgi:histidine ammonia-lyase
MSHSVGVGSPIDKDLSKLMLILKVQALAKGYSGISIDVVDRILWHIEEDIIPIVPEQGSVGASGDLAPLSHLFLPLIGMGQVYWKNEIHNTENVFLQLGISKIELGPKSVLALINGTQFIAAHAVKLVDKMHDLLTQADIVGAMMVEGLLGSKSPFDMKLHTLRPHEGNKLVAHRMRKLLQDSEIMESHRSCSKVQDPYSLRCIPQVHGASRNAWKHLKELVEIEINSVTDNPLVFSEEETISGGNFHGQPLAMVLDYACLAIAELGNISDRRCYLSLEGKSERTPKLLMENTGVNSGFMILQYTTAALVSENKGLCFPASADSIPTSLGQEDHVSMGSIAARKALKVLENVEKILAIELICASQAIDFKRPLKSSAPIDRIHEYVRQHIAHADKDRVFANDVNKAIEIIQSSKIIDLAEDVLQQNISEFDIF